MPSLDVATLVSPDESKVNIMSTIFMSENSTETSLKEILSYFR